MHNCRATGKLGEFIFLCSDCGQCYACRHKIVCFEDGEYRTKCPTGPMRGKWQLPKFDGKLRDPNFQPDPPGLMVIKSTDEALIDKALKDYWENGDLLEKQASKGFNGKEWIIVFPNNKSSERQYSPGLS